MTMFDKTKVSEWRRTDSLVFAKCLTCEPTRSDSQQYSCNKCKRKLPLSAFGPQVQSRRDFSKCRCDDCSRPSCGVCGLRPTDPVTHSIDPTNYRCQSCLCPACKQCGATRPSKAKRQLWPCRTLSWARPSCTRSIAESRSCPSSSRVVSSCTPCRQHPAKDENFCAKRVAPRHRKHLQSNWLYILGNS